MALVKGTPNKRVKVIEYRLRHILAVCLCAVCILSAVAGGAYYSGYTFGMGEQEQALRDVARLTESSAHWQSKADEYEQLLVNSKTAAEVDRQASEGVRKEVIDLKDEIARLSEENNFYRGLMAPNERASGLTIGSVEILRSGDAGSYNFKVVIQQLAQRHNVLSGHLTFSVLGRQDGVETTYPLMMLSDSVDAEKIRLRFKYFQVVEGEFGLPENFEPEGIEIEAVTSGSKPQQAAKKFGWLVEEV